MPGDPPAAVDSEDAAAVGGQVAALGATARGEHRLVFDEEYDRTGHAGRNRVVQPSLQFPDRVVVVAHPTRIQVADLNRAGCAGQRAR